MDMATFMEGIRRGLVLSPATTEMMFKQHLGWDFGNPRAKGSLAPASGGRRIMTAIDYFPDDVEVVF
jgi:hypothetical protein